MIDKNTLQIGNIVMPWGNFGIINELRQHFAVIDFGYPDKTSNVNYSAIAPVPLDEKVLRAAGFSPYNWDWPGPPKFPHLNIGDIIARVHSEGVSLFRINPCDGERKNFVCNAINYLHQLQTAVQVLTGQPIQIDLQKL